MNSLLRMLSGGSTVASDLKSEVNDLWANTIQPIVEIVLWILVIVLALVFIVKAVTTAMAVMKAADEPQVRQEKIQGFKYLAIGLGVAIVVISLANVIISLVTERQIDLEDSGVSTFLF